MVGSLRYFGSFDVDLPADLDRLNPNMTPRSISG